MLQYGRKKGRDQEKKTELAESPLNLAHVTVTLSGHRGAAEIVDWGREAPHCGYTAHALSRYARFHDRGEGVNALSASVFSPVKGVSCRATRTVVLVGCDNVYLEQCPPLSKLAQHVSHLH